MILINAILALMGVILAGCAIARMSRETADAPRFAVVLVGTGLLGQALMLGAMTATDIVYELTGELVTFQLATWTPYFDTLLYGGIVAYFVACRRYGLGLTFEWMQRFSIGISAATFLYFLGNVIVT